MILDSINQELKESLKNGDSEKVGVLRMLKSAIKNTEIEKQADFSKKDVVLTLRKEAKKRQDSIKLFQDNGRQELANTEQRELEIIQAFLPSAMSEDDLNVIIDQVVKETNAATISDMGRVMQAVMQKAGDAADGSMVSNLVRSRLQ
ncbi:MAG: hypothetical protein ACD_83C00077G0004 [uncultured bacterium]|uniref:GatB/Yqey domain protein n=1 Tax=Berkelbacteria bacterium GW2011_GWA2_38_9 TaxID=1618334 RepID=A0A0G0LET6_9BACT|nr:MAG: hypothetical protein ACD_83C00077G0004 [uncultured bacterium]KKQ86455.1 MAG: GatB/Yqey domain protein [Berkelbacteria bacterium GW2011_GWA2_38_9]